jgi:hypothetical protein
MVRPGGGCNRGQPAQGRATQALQNLNLAFGFDELAGIRCPQEQVA